MEQAAWSEAVTPAFTHFALCVTDLHAAETMYAYLFDLEVAFREAPGPDGWATLPASGIIGPWKVSSAEIAWHGRPMRRA